MSGVHSNSIAPPWASRSAVGSIPGPALPPPTQPGSQTTERPEQILNPSGVLTMAFGITDMGANLTASQLYRQVSGATPQGAQIGVSAPYRGSILGMGWQSDAALTAGTAVFVCYIDGVASKATLKWSAGTRAQQNFPASTYPFPVGASLDVRLTTVGFAPTTADGELVLIVSFTPE